MTFQGIDAAQATAKAACAFISTARQRQNMAESAAGGAAE